MRSSRKRTLWGLAAIAVLAGIPLVDGLGGTTAQADDARPGDGTTTATAGASCWGIKQQHPSSATGIYWLSNASMDRPAQFHCDMTTDGGGWVLIGRGRNGWTFAPTGQGSPATVRSAVDGPAAFAPAALDNDTVNQLLGNQPAKGLADGIRLERATNSTGSQRQDIRLFSRRDRFSWSFDAGDPLASVRIDRTTYQGSNARDTAGSVPGQTTNQLSGQQGVRRIFTFGWASHNHVKGFSHGTGVNGGSNAAGNYLWTYDREGSPLPFTTVWVRPRIANAAAGFTPIPAAGFAAQAKPAQFKNRSEVAPWGVVGLNRVDEPRIEPYSTPVLALKTRGDRVYVGGRFTGVQQGPSGREIAQPSLAAFDLDGNWISSFRPQIDGRVWDLLFTPDGKLIIAGDFRSVNGLPNTSGMAALDPATGEVITSWKADVTRADGARHLVRALSFHNGFVYAAGNFNRVTGGTWNQITVSSAVNVSAANGTPGTWRPRLSGSAVRIRVSQDGSRVLLSGYFNAINNEANQGYFGIVNSTDGAVVPGIGSWIPSVGSNAKYQQAVADLGDNRVLVGGSEHNFQVWNANRTQLLDAFVTKQGGDTQSIEVYGDQVVMACHCADWVYSGSNNYSSPSGFRAVDPINLVGVWDRTTMQYDTSWYPSGLKGEYGEGVWTTDLDQRGCLWVGGDLKRGSWSGNAATDYLGGFGRFCRQDAEAPTAPTNLTVDVSASGATVRWAGATDDSGSVQYDVYKDDRVIATVWGLSYTDATLTSGTSARYTVRATDARGNRSASPAPVAVNGPPPAIGVVKTFGTNWKYADAGTDLGTAWRNVGFNDAAWPSGNGMLGWGKTGVVTQVGSTKPQTVYFRSTFQVADPAQVRVLDLGVKQATGSVVYINGVEVGRINMPTGAITATSPGAGYISGAVENQINKIVVPGRLLRAGTNTVAVELHSMTRGASRAFFDLEATAYAATADQAKPSAPSLSAQAAPGRVTLTWTAATDNVALGGYLISRDGQPLAVTGPSATGYVDGVVDTSVPHRYVVTAFDTNGNATDSNTVELGVPADPNLLAFGSTWRWSFTPEGQPNGWQNPSFNDTTWATGPAELGFGDGDEKTLLTTAPKGPWPNTAYFRTTINIPNPNAFTTILATLIRDDGAAIYINGTEVARDNLPAGPLTPATPASSGLSTRGQETAQIPITIPATAFVPGTNTIAVEVHNFDPWSSDLSFDLRLTGQP